MSKFPWTKPISIRSSDEAHRHGFSIDSLLLYSGVFFSIFWVWNRFTWYATFFDNNDIPFRLSDYMAATEGAVEKFTLNEMTKIV